MTRPWEKSTSSETMRCRASGARGAADEYLGAKGLHLNDDDCTSVHVSLCDRDCDAKREVKLLTAAVQSCMCTSQTQFQTF